MISTAQQNTRSEAPVTDRIPLSEPVQTGREWELVRDCLETNWLSTAGPYVSRLEAMVADRLGVTHAVATSSGTAALHVALEVAGVLPDDEVLAPSLTFIASINAIRYAGAHPVLIGSDLGTAQLSVNHVESFVRTRCRKVDGVLYNTSTGRRVAAMMPVHILGHPCDMAPLLELAEENGLVVVEDACEALGAQYKGRDIGSFGHIACFSFNGNKTITAGAGGMIVTNRTEWGQRARHLTTQAKQEGPEFIHTEVGYNYRLSNLHAAIGCAQFDALDSYIAKKRAIANQYHRALSVLPGIRPIEEAAWATSTCWLSAFRIDEVASGKTSRELQEALNVAGIESRPLWQPGHLSSVYGDVESFRCESSTRLYDEVLCLPSSVSLTREQQDRVIAAIERTAR
jgi:perosamine synthetase